MNITYIDTNLMPIDKHTANVIYRLHLIRQGLLAGLYIGQTRQPFNIRLAQHLSSTCLCTVNEFCINNNVDEIVAMLIPTPPETLNDCEKADIASAIALG